MEKKDISRRGFIKGMAAGAVSVAGFGLLSACKALAEEPAAAPAKGLYTPGTYSAQAEGMGKVTVTMTFDTDKITDVVLDLSTETPDIGQAAETELKEAIMAAQNAEIDSVSGATITTSAVKKAASKCIQQAKGEIPVEIITADVAGTSTEAGPDAWLGEEPEIPDSSITAEYETEILVIGCGHGGLMAIASAAEAGAKVLGIDRFAAGTGVRDDIGGINSRYQKEWGTKIDKWDYVTMATQYAAGHINQDLVKLFCDESGAMVDWYGDRLAERGVELWHESPDSADDTRYEHFATGHSPRWTGSDDGTGKELDGAKVLTDYAVKCGAEFHYNTKMIKLVKENGRVTGCIATNEKDEYVRYTATKGVIMATGGYARNYDMIEALQPWNGRVLGGDMSMAGTQGDGIKACLWAGAKMDETHSMMIFDRQALKPEHKPGLDHLRAGEPSGFFWMGSQPFLKVNADGKRYFNESGTYEGITHADEYQKGHCHYTLFDANWTSYVQQFKMHGCSRLYPFENGADPNIPWVAIENGMLPGLIAEGFVAQADTIEELAEKLKLPAEALAATVKRYNELCAKGEDEDYGKEPHRLTPVDTAPFYGAKNAGGVLCTLDGIQIDTNMNAIDTEGEPIPGLYVIGDCSGGYFANTYPNLSTGMAAGRTFTFARHVAKYLAEL